MRLIHTADWHLGRLFHNQHLTDDQEHVLLQLIELADEIRPEAVLVAGDLYDRAVPPTEAVDLLDHVLTELVDRLGVTVIAIAGNHDSAARVGFASSLLSGRGLYAVGKLEQTAAPIVLRDEHGLVRVGALPYADPTEARAAYADPDIHDQQAVSAAGVARALAAAQPQERLVLVAHAFVAGGLESQSERPLSVGGAQQVSADTFAGFDYVALGHLHRPQTCGSDRVRYAGSLLKYSFAEHAHDKSVCVVDIGPPGSASGERGSAGRAAVAVETVALKPRRDVRRVEGTLAELLERGPSDPRNDDYVLASLLDRGALLDPIGQLRAVYPNTLSIERPVYEGVGAGELRRPRPGSVGDLELFGTFFNYATGDDLSAAEREELTAVLGTLDRRRRETGP
jgi:DNA repair protein SbcD/Mre11